MISIQKYAQRDPRWGKMQLGTSGLEVEDYGCTSVVSASALGVDPITFVSRMNTAKPESGYTPTGLLRWYVASALFGGNVELSPAWSSTPADLEYIKNFIRQGYPVVLQTRFPGNYSTAERDKVDHQHWLVAIDENLTIYDPWYDRTEPFEKTYGDPKRWIFSASCFKKKLDVPASDTFLDKPKEYWLQIEKEREQFWKERDEARKARDEFAVALEGEKAKSKSLDDLVKRIAAKLGVPAEQEEIEKSITSLIEVEDDLSKAQSEVANLTSKLTSADTLAKSQDQAILTLTQKNKDLESQLKTALANPNTTEYKNLTILFKLGKSYVLVGEVK